VGGTVRAVFFQEAAELGVMRASGLGEPGVGTAKPFSAIARVGASL
jgi:hypothetical protein